MIDIRALSYVVVDHPQPLEWATFAERVLGMQASLTPDGEVWLKMDERAHRIIVRQRVTPRYAVSGWEVADESAFDRAFVELERAGANPIAGNAASRGCIDVISFSDPAGNQHEIALGFKTDFARFTSPTDTHFITGELGVGHVALPALPFDACWAFFRDVLGFGLGDFMRHGATANDPGARIYFLHCNNARHHSLALAEMSVPSGCVHLMVEVPDMDEVGRAMDRRQKYGSKLMATLGRHVNDRMTSFYLQSPSGFSLEYGYGGRLIDWDRNVVHETTAVSLWGHDFSLGFS